MHANKLVIKFADSYYTEVDLPLNSILDATQLAGQSSFLLNWRSKVFKVGRNDFYILWYTVLDKHCKHGAMFHLDLYEASSFWTVDFHVLFKYNLSKFF